MADTFLDVLKRSGIEGALPRSDCGGPAAQDLRPSDDTRAWDFAFATGIECSNPSVADPNGGGGLRGGLLGGGGGYPYFPGGLAVGEEMGGPRPRFGFAKHPGDPGPAPFDWSFSGGGVGGNKGP